MVVWLVLKPLAEAVPWTLVVGVGLMALGLEALGVPVLASAWTAFDQAILAPVVSWAESVITDAVSGALW